MNFSRAQRKMRTNADSLKPRRSKFDAYFPYFDKHTCRNLEKNNKKSSSRKARCESVHSTRTSCKRSTTPIFTQKEGGVSENCYKKIGNEEKIGIKRFDRSTQRSPKSFIVGRRKFKKNPDSTLDFNTGIIGNRPCSSLSRKYEDNSRDKVKDLNKYFEEFYEKSKVLLQKFEANMKKGKIV